MPVYVYRCLDCEAEMEVHQSFHDDPLTTCPHCSGRLRKVFQPAPIIFKGSGWHITDRRRSDNGSKSSSNVESSAAGSDD